MHIAQASSFESRSSAVRRVLPSEALPPIAATIDAGMLLLASGLATLFYRLYADEPAATPSGSLAVGLTAALLFILIARTQGLYRFEALVEPAGRLARVAFALGLSLLVLTFVLFLLKVGAEYSRLATVAFAALAAVLAPLGRLVLGAAARAGVHSGVVRGRPAIALGDAAEMESLDAGDLLRFGVEEVARVVLVGDSTFGRLGDADRNRVTQAIRLSRELGAVEFALLTPWGRDRELAEIARLLQVSPLPVRLYPDRKVRAIVRQHKGRDLDPYFSIKIQREPLARWERSLKRASDVAVAAAALAVLSPLLLATAVLIKLDSRGPAIFRQRRGGFDDREFVIFKFRTMTVMEDDGPIVQTRREDQRVTRVGRVLRRTSIDELPQLFNVLRGDMSLVGPRPHALAHDNEYGSRIDKYALRRHVKPGLTGAAQVAGLRGETRDLALMEQRVERDLWYINNWSLALDLRILAQTCFALLRADAY